MAGVVNFCALSNVQDGGFTEKVWRLGIKFEMKIECFNVDGEYTVNGNYAEGIIVSAIVQLSRIRFTLTATRNIDRVPLRSPAFQVEPGARR